VHAAGLVIGDVNESNVLVSDRATVSLVDCDSWQVRDDGDVFRCPVGRPEYTPPELQGSEYQYLIRGRQHDNFALGVLVWRLLMGGTHPFDACWIGSGTPLNLPQRIAAGLFPHVGVRGLPVRPPAMGPPLQSLDRRVRNLMISCFSDGHASPGCRPDAATWQFVLYRAEQGLQRCSRRPRHVYAERLRQCPWCRHAGRTGVDLFA